MTMFLIFSQLMRNSLIEHLSNLLQMLNDLSVVDVEFFGNFLCSCKRIGFDDPLNWLLLTSDGPPLRSSSRLKALISIAKLLEPSLHCTFVSNSKCIVDVAS